MNAKDRTNRATQLTQGILEQILLKPEILVAMEIHKVTPEAVGCMVKDILDYIYKTAAER